MFLSFGSLADIARLQLVIFDVLLYQPIQYGGGAGLLYQRALL